MTPDRLRERIAEAQAVGRVARWEALLWAVGLVAGAAASALWPMGWAP